MNNPKSLKAIIAVLLLALFTSLGFLARALSNNFSWKLQVESLALYEGSTRARHDFQSGKLRLFVLSGGRSEDKFSGTNDGPYEVWFPQYFPEVRSFRYATETMVTAYNDLMRYLHEHPERHLDTTNTTAQKVGP